MTKKRRSRSRRKKKGSYRVHDILYIIGSIVGILIAVFAMIPDVGTGYAPWSWGEVWYVFFLAPVAIFLCLLILSSENVIRIRKVSMRYHWIAYLILGIVIVVLTPVNWGGVIIVVGAVLHVALT